MSENVNSYIYKVTDGNPESIRLDVMLSVQLAFQGIDVPSQPVYLAPLENTL